MPLYNHQNVPEEVKPAEEQGKAPTENTEEEEKKLLESAKIIKKHLRLRI